MAILTEIPLQTLSLTASGAVVKETFVKADGAKAGNGANAVGVAKFAADDGDELSVVTEGIVRITAGGTVAVNARVQSDANGKAITIASGGQELGTALTAGSADSTMLIKLG